MTSGLGSQDAFEGLTESMSLVFALQLSGSHTLEKASFDFIGDAELRDWDSTR